MKKGKIKREKQRGKEIEREKQGGKK